jgi:hypothetical protein
MGRLGAALRGWLRLAPWLLLLGALAGSGWWRYYVAPRQVPYLWAGLAALGSVLLMSELDGLLGREARRRSALRQRQPIPQPKPARPGDWLEAGVHWLPLTLLAVLGPTTLTLSGGRPSAAQLAHMGGGQPAARLPATAYPPAQRHYYVLPPRPDNAGAAVPAQPRAALAQPAPAPPKPTAAKPSRPAASALPTQPAQPRAALAQPAPAPPKPTAAKPSRPAASALPTHSASPTQPALPASVHYRPTDLAKLFSKHGEAKDEPVVVVGRLHKVKGDDLVVPEGVNPRKVDYVLYRLVIWCCIADAIPATAILKDAPPDKLPADAWVRLSGRLERTGPEHDIPLLKVDKVEAIAEPDEPYLYISPDEL